MSHPLGKWALIDIETTGADASSDTIIDVGFLAFNGTKLEKTYSSLVNYKGELSHFIQKLTGIKPQMLKNAPIWSEVKLEVQSLYGYDLLAHNADFEESFLKETFDEVEDGSDRETYQDSIYYLSILFPQYSSLKLENFIIDFGISDFEMHRGFEDSLDLLKVILIGNMYVRRDSDYYRFLTQLFDQYGLEDFWFKKFLFLSIDELYEIADQIDFDLDEAVSKASKIQHELFGEPEEISASERRFPLDFSGANITNILQSEDKIREVIPYYSLRDSQLELSKKLGQCFTNNVHAMVQAPTGTGKTFGYLLPSALYTLNNEKQVLVATGTKALQEQAIYKDVPQLRSVLGLSKTDLKVVKMVGSGNHLCELLYRQNINDSAFLSKALPFDDAFVELYFSSLFYYNSNVPYDRKIIRDGVPFVLKMKKQNFSQTEKDIAVDFRSCTGYNCPHKETCSYHTGINEAKDAKIIIGNHSLMFSWPRAFPRPTHIVVDEAHKIESEATSSFTYEVSNGQLDAFVKNIKHNHGLGSLYYLLEDDDGVPNSKDIASTIKDEANSMHIMLTDHMVALPELIEQHFKKRSYYTDTFWNECEMVYDDGASSSLGISIFNSFSSIRNTMLAFLKLIEQYTVRWDITNTKDENQSIALTRFKTFSDQLCDIVEALDTLLEKKEGFAHSLKFHEVQGYVTNSAPINVGQVLHDGLLETSQSVFYTSATLGNASGNIGSKGVEWATGYLYLEPTRRFRTGYFLPPVYDYENNAQVFLCDDTPQMFKHDFVPIVMAQITKLIENIGGKTLLLFSARARFETAREILLEKFEGKIPIHVQGMGKNVVDDFKEKGGILLGMETFGEGIDVPGDNLQLVFVDKIPDLRRDFVIEKRQDFYESAIGNQFTDYYLAGRTRSLHQKLGRLIRRTSDTGCAIIVDSRVRKWKGRTMGQLLDLLSPYKVQRTDLKSACESAEKFISN